MSHIFTATFLPFFSFLKLFLRSLSAPTFCISFLFLLLSYLFFIDLFHSSPSVPFSCFYPFLSISLSHLFALTGFVSLSFSLSFNSLFVVFLSEYPILPFSFTGFSDSLQGFQLYCSCLHGPYFFRSLIIIYPVFRFLLLYSEICQNGQVC